MGAVAYDPKVVTIWDGFRRWFARRDFDFDYVLYSNYERQVEDLLAGRIDVAWNSPLAWVGPDAARPARRVRSRRSRCATPTATSRRSSSCVADSAMRARRSARQDRWGRRGRLAAGDADPARPPRALGSRRRARLRGAPLRRRRRPARRPRRRRARRGPRLIAGEVDAACMIDGNHLAFTHEGTLPRGRHGDRPDRRLRPLQHDGRADAGRPARLDRFGELLLAMSYADPAVRPLLDLEGPGVQGSGAPLEPAVDGHARDSTPQGRGRSPLGPTIDLDDLGFDRGAHLLVERALTGLTPGERCASPVPTRR